MALEYPVVGLAICVCCPIVHLKPGPPEVQTGRGGQHDYWRLPLRRNPL